MRQRATSIHDIHDAARSMPDGATTKLSTRCTAATCMISCRLHMAACRLRTVHHAQVNAATSERQCRMVDIIPPEHTGTATLVISHGA